MPITHQTASRRGALLLVEGGCKGAPAIESLHSLLDERLLSVGFGSIGAVGVIRPQGLKRLYD
jgi:hypothetical protein